MKIRYDNLRENLYNQTLDNENINKKQKIENSENIKTFNELYPNDFHQLIINKYDPILNINNLVKKFRPLLMINGGSDNLVPLQCNQNYYNKIKPLYDINNKSELLEFVILDNVKHETPPEMINKSINFLKKWLKNENQAKL